MFESKSYDNSISVRHSRLEYPKLTFLPVDDKTVSFHQIYGIRQKSL